MVDIVRLAAHESPPKDKDWLWITRDSVGRYRCEGSASLQKELETVLDNFSSEVDLNVILERARE
jgi:hypothetical protein